MDYVVTFLTLNVALMQVSSHLQLYIQSELKMQMVMRIAGQHAALAFEDIIVVNLVGGSAQPSSVLLQNLQWPSKIWQKESTVCQ